MNKNKLQLLSKLYFKKSLGYNWYDILKLKSRQSVIQDINKYDNISIKRSRNTKIDSNTIKLTKSINSLLGYKRIK